MPSRFPEQAVTSAASDADLRLKTYHAKSLISLCLFSYISSFLASSSSITFVWLALVISAPVAQRATCWPVRLTTNDSKFHLIGEAADDVQILHDRLHDALIKASLFLHSPASAHAGQLASSSMQPPGSPINHLKSGCADGPLTSTFRNKSNLADLREVANAKISSGEPGSWPPKALHGKARMERPLDAYRE